MRRITFLAVLAAVGLLSILCPTGRSPAAAGLSSGDTTLAAGASIKLYSCFIKGGSHIHSPQFYTSANGCERARSGYIYTSAGDVRVQIFGPAGVDSSGFTVRSRAAFNGLPPCDSLSVLNTSSVSTVITWGFHLDYVGQGMSPGAVAAPTDASGIWRLTEEYPPQLQATRLVLASFTTKVAVTTGLKQIGNSVSAHPWGYRAFEIERAATGGAAVDPLFLYLFTSDDNTNFYPVSRCEAWNTTGAAADTSLADTLMARLPAAGANASRMIWSVPDCIYGGRYLSIFAKRDSTASTVQSLGIAWVGRYR